MFQFVVEVKHKLSIIFIFMRLPFGAIPLQCIYQIKWVHCLAQLNSTQLKLTFRFSFTGILSCVFFFQPATLFPCSFFCFVLMCTQTHCEVVHFYGQNAGIVNKKNANVKEFRSSSELNGDQMLKGKRQKSHSNDTEKCASCSYKNRIEKGGIRLNHLHSFYALITSLSLVNGKCSTEWQRREMKHTFKPASQEL